MPLRPVTWRSWLAVSSRAGDRVGRRVASIPERTGPWRCPVIVAGVEDAGGRHGVERARGRAGPARQVVAGVEPEADRVEIDGRNVARGDVDDRGDLVAGRLVGDEHQVPPGPADAAVHLAALVVRRCRTRRSSRHRSAACPSLDLERVDEDLPVADRTRRQDVAVQPERSALTHRPASSIVPRSRLAGRGLEMDAADVAPGVVRATRAPGYISNRTLTSGPALLVGERACRRHCPPASQRARSARCTGRDVVAVAVVGRVDPVDADAALDRRVDVHRVARRRGAGDATR